MGQHAELTGTCRTCVQQTPRLSNELELCRASIQYALASNVTDKLVDYLQDEGAAINGKSPDSVEIYNDTGIVIGFVGWHEIATQENIREVLSHTTFQLVYG
jgi:hypothetical protein